MKNVTEKSQIIAFILVFYYRNATRTVNTAPLLPMVFYRHRWSLYRLTRPYSWASEAAHYWSLQPF